MLSNVVFWLFLVACGLLICDELRLFFIEYYSGFNPPRTSHEKWGSTLKCLMVLGSAVLVVFGKIRRF